MATSTRERKATIEYRAYDGRVSKSVHPDYPIVAYKFADGREQTVDVYKLPDHIQKTGSIRGVTERGRDTYAGSDTVDEAFDECAAVIETLQGGDWAAERQKGEAAPSLFLEAITVVLQSKGKTPDVAKLTAMFSGKDGKANRDALLNGADGLAIKKAIADIQYTRRMAALEKATPATDGGVGLDSLA